MIAYSLLEWPFNRNIDGLDPVWVSHEVSEHSIGALCYSFPMVVHASAVTIVVENKIAKVTKAPNHLPSWRNLVLENFDLYIDRSVNIQQDVQEFLKGVNPLLAPERIAVCFEKQSDYKYSPTEEFDNFISTAKFKGQTSKGIVGNVETVVQKQTEECKDCNGEH
jgi:hypothetical protein